MKKYHDDRKNTQLQFVLGVFETIVVWIIFFLAFCNILNGVINTTGIATALATLVSNVRYLTSGEEKHNIKLYIICMVMNMLYIIMMMTLVLGAGLQNLVLTVIILKNVVMVYSYLALITKPLISTIELVQLLKKMFK